jgi:hypothetical protein
MTPWTIDELAKIGAAEDPRMATRRREGMLRNPGIARFVRHDDDSSGCGVAPGVSRADPSRGGSPRLGRPIRASTETRPGVARGD